MRIIKTTPNFKTHTNIIKRHVDENGSQIVEQVYNEQKQIVKNHIVLEQIPHPHYSMDVSYIDNNTTVRLSSIAYAEDIYDTNQYKVDFTQGKIWVHPTLEGKMLNISYWGIGYELIHASRVYTELNKNGDIVESLDDIITKSEIALKFLEDLPQAIVEGREIVKTINEGKVLKVELETLIEDGSLLKSGLEGAIIEGIELSNKLETNITNAFDVNVVLENNITVATELNTNLDGNIVLGNQLLDKTIGVNDTLTDLVEANRVAKEEILPEIDKYDNAKFNVFDKDWFLDNGKHSVSIAHNLNSKNLIVACYDSSNKSIDFEITLTDSNNIVITHLNAIDMTVIVNIAYRGKAGDIDGGTGGLTVSDIENVKNIPNIENRIDNIIDVTIPEIYSSITPDNLLTSIKTVDGVNSGLDAEYLCGRPSSEFVTIIGGTLENSKSIRGKDSLGTARHLISMSNQDSVVIGDSNYKTTIMCKNTPEHFDGNATVNMLTGNNASVKAGAFSIEGYPLYIQPNQPPTNINGAIWIKNI